MRAGSHFKQEMCQENVCFATRYLSMNQSRVANQITAFAIVY